jgi:hypothetical protein
MGINPDTLTEESDEERRERQRRTGVLGNGVTVICTPDLTQPDVTEVQHRAVCLVRPYPSCVSCRHGCFTLSFNANAQAKYEQVKCPAWCSPVDRLKGKSPSDYQSREIATCLEQPYEFCPSCPKREELSKLGIDKNKDGWYSRWQRFKKDAEAHDE